MSKYKIDSKPIEPTISFVQKVIKDDTYMVLSSAKTEMEDEFTSLYWTTSLQNNVLIQPPYNPKELKRLVYHNNILNQCVQAMEVNIDGTGFSIVGVEKDKDPDSAEADTATSFFTEPYPGVSFTELRRLVRRDVESVGYGYLEAVRALDGTLAGVRYINNSHIRLVKLGDPELVKKVISRNGKDVSISLYERERRFQQKIGNFTKHYREFNSSRELNMLTGEWEKEGQPIDSKNRATELILFSADPDVSTPYSVPRWINVLPSVIGSRKAEEANLEFFDSGGMPPAIIFVQGGVLAKDASDQLRQYLTGQSKSRHRAVVVEALSSSGSLDSAGTVQVKVERFGTESTKDAMYANYDKAAEEKVRTAFRLPPMFLGKAADYNFATAMTSYMVAEAQVFQPEREEFDNIINRTLVKALGLKTVKFQSNPIRLKDVATQLKLLELAKDVVEGDGWVESVNNMSDGTLKYKEPPPPPPAVPQTFPKDSNVVNIGQAKKEEGALEVFTMASQYAAIEGLNSSQHSENFSEVEKEEILSSVKKLEGNDLEAFQKCLSQIIFGRTSPDLESLAHTH